MKAPRPVAAGCDLQSGSRLPQSTAAAPLRTRHPNCSRPRAVYFHTSHPGLCAALRITRGWAQCSSVLFGGDKTKSARSIIKSLGTAAGSGGYGGHSRAVQGFKFTGTPA